MKARYKQYSYMFCCLLIMLSYQNCGNQHNFKSSGSLIAGNGDGDINSDADILPLCQTADLTVQEFEISFDENPDGCDWGNNGNLDYREGRMRARYEQVQNLAIPAGSVLCDLDFMFEEQNFYYDDQVILTLNNRVLMSTQMFNNHFNHDEAGPIYDWLKIVDIEYGVGETNIWCNGSNSTCELPDTQDNGEILLEFPRSVVQKITQKTSQTNYELKMITTGDNDGAIDCKHDPISFRLKATYKVQ